MIASSSLLPVGYEPKVAVDVIKDYQQWLIKKASDYEPWSSLSME